MPQKSVAADSPEDVLLPDGARKALQVLPGRQARFAEGHSYEHHCCDWRFVGISIACLLELVVFRRVGFKVRVASDDGS